MPALDDPGFGWARVWVAALTVVSIANATAVWRVVSEAESKRVARTSTQYTLWMRRCAVAYVAVCALRAIMPRVDVERICFYESVLSYPFVGRSGASIAEVAFFAQLSGTVYRLANDAAHVARAQGAPTHQSALSRVRTVSVLALVLIVVAECCSWYGVATQFQLLNGVEESLWAIAVALLAPCCVYLFLRFRRAGVWAAVESSCGGTHDASTRVALGSAMAAWGALVGIAVAAVPFVAYMALVDVPMYVTRWRAGQAEGRTYLGFGEGVLDSMSCASVDRRWSTWAEEAMWMTPYFTACVWFSVWLAAYAPRVDTDVPGMRALIEGGGKAKRQ